MTGSACRRSRKQGNDASTHLASLQSSSQENTAPHDRRHRGRPAASHLHQLPSRAAPQLAHHRHPLIVTVQQQSPQAPPPEALRLQARSNHQHPGWSAPFLPLALGQLRVLQASLPNDQASCLPNRGQGDLASITRTGATSPAACKVYRERRATAAHLAFTKGGRTPPGNSPCLLCTASGPFPVHHPVVLGPSDRTNFIQVKMNC